MKENFEQFTQEEKSPIILAEKRLKVGIEEKIAERNLEEVSEEQRNEITIEVLEDMMQEYKEIGNDEDMHILEGFMELEVTKRDKRESDRRMAV